MGISAYYHDSAAAIVVDGEIIAAAQEERFTRKKHDPSFPKNAVEYCLKEANLKIEELDAVVFYDKPLLKFERLLETYLTHAPKGIISFLKAMPIWVKDKLFLKSIIKKELKAIGELKKFSLPILFADHHLSHAASAFYPSPFEEAAILTIDGVGEWATASIARGKGNSIELIEEMHFPDSVGLLYSAFTYYLGFRVNSGEYKLMGLAPYGDLVSEETQRFISLIKEKLVTIFDDGSIHIDQSYFEYAVGERMTSNAKWAQLFGFERLKEDTAFTQIHCNLALAIQVVTEEIVMKLVHHAQKITGIQQVCMAGGVALNCAANGKLLSTIAVSDLFIQPAAGDAGGALGAALAGQYIFFGEKRVVSQSDTMKGAFLGPSFSNEEIEQSLIKFNATYERISSNEVAHRTAQLLTEKKVVGWFQGRAEFGPRALGNRSILADATDVDMQQKLNLKIKFREGFRPFAPIVLVHKVKAYFELDGESPYMLLIAPVAKEKRIAIDSVSSKCLSSLSLKRSVIPAVTHVDFSARVQTIDENRNQKLFDLLSEFDAMTGMPVLINTSFNVRGEPPVLTPEDAYQCFMQTDMDALVIGDFLLIKENQATANDKEMWSRKFERD